MTNHTPVPARHVLTNCSVFARLEGRASIDAWFYALSQLACRGRKPGLQLVDFDRSPSKIKRALPLLVEAGVLRQNKASARFYVPRSMAKSS